MKDKIIEIVSSILKITPEELGERIDDKEVWDSLTRVEILFAIEEELDIYLDDSELADITTPQKLIEVIEGK